MKHDKEQREYGDHAKRNEYGSRDIPVLSMPVHAAICPVCLGYRRAFAQLSVVLLTPKNIMMRNGIWDFMMGTIAVPAFSPQKR